MSKLITILIGFLIFSGDSFRKVKNLLGAHWRTSLSGLVSAALCFFFHSEYLSWVEITGDKTYVTLSFIIKNFILLFLAFRYIYKPLKISPESHDKTLQGITEKLDEPQPEQDRLDKIFNDLREKEALVSAAERALHRDGSV